MPKYLLCYTQSALIRKYLYCEYAYVYEKYVIGGVPIKDDPIAQLLDDLMKIDEILACMVARRNMISVMPSSNGFKPEINEIWDIIKRAMDDVFNVIRDYSPAGLGKMEFQVQDYEVLFYVFPDTENALVAVIPAFANKGLIQIDMENARREILKIREQSEKGEIQVTV